LRHGCSIVNNSNKQRYPISDLLWLVFEIADGSGAYKNILQQQEQPMLTS